VATSAGAAECSIIGASAAVVTGASLAGPRDTASTLSGMARLRVAACQLDTVVGDLHGNVAAIGEALETAERAGCDLAVFPELAITGYPPEDLLLKPRFVADNLEALEKVAARTGRCAAVVGFVDADRDLHNAAAVCAMGAVQGVYHKRLLPNYAVFDEQRYFVPGTRAPSLFVIGGVRVGVSICEDAWSPSGPVAEQAAGGAELVVNLNASPYYAGRLAERERMLAVRAADASCALVYVNQVGGQDELVFDGASLVYDAAGELVARGPQFAEHVLIADVDCRPVFRKRLLDPRGRVLAPALAEVTISAETVVDLINDRRPPELTEPMPPLREVYEALVLGTRDYVRKNGFTDVVIGLSGGIDSSLVAVIATDALGADHVHGVSMPSRFSSAGANDDAAALAANLGIDHRVVPIEPAHAAFLDMLAPSFGDLPPDLAEENVQARVRGTTLMALSNKFGWLVLTTGNKSEMAAGFSTLYGDMAGGFAVIKDVPKMLVYELCRDRNERAGRAVIPEPVFTKAPSAELRPDQRDDESLPPYGELDPVLEAYVEGDMTATELEEAGFDPVLVRRVVTLVDRAEYKRRQAPPGVRVSPKAFGKDRRLPITNRYSG
jgi:NAD+ synthase (glutamine-hydrolysing)